MKVYLVTNGDFLTMAVFRHRASANRFIREVGKKRWRESWSIIVHHLDTPEQWVLNGSDAFQARRGI